MLLLTGFCAGFLGRCCGFGCCFLPSCGGWCGRSTHLDRLGKLWSTDLFGDGGSHERVELSSGCGEMIIDGGIKVGTKIDTSLADTIWTHFKTSRLKVGSYY